MKGCGRVWENSQLTDVVGGGGVFVLGKLAVEWMSPHSWGRVEESFESHRSLAKDFQLYLVDLKPRGLR